MNSSSENVLLITFFINFIIYLSSYHVVTAFSIGNYTLEGYQRNLDTTQKTNFCELHDQVERGNIELRNALRDANISVKIFDNELDESSAEVKILDELAKRAHFTWRDRAVVELDILQNQTWTKMLNYTTNRYDLAANQWARTLERLALGITFTEQVDDSSLIMIQVKTGENSNSKMKTWNIMFLPFTWEVWLLIILTILVSGLTYYVIDFIIHREHKETKSIRDSFYYSFQVLTGTSTYNPTHAPNRVLLISLRFFSIIIVAAFRASLTSLLINQSEEVTLNIFEDAVHNNYRICVLKGIADVVLTQQRYPTGKYIEKDKQLQVYEALRNGECEVALDFRSSFKSFRNKIEYNPTCNLEWVGRKVTMTPSSFSIKASGELCSSLFRDALDLHLLEMTLDGTLPMIIEGKQNVTTNQCNMESQSSDGIELTVSELSGVFIIFVVLTAIAIILAILFRYKHPKNLSIVKRALKGMDSLSERYSQKGRINAPQEIGKGVEEDDEQVTVSSQELQRYMINLHEEIKNELKEEWISKNRNEVLL